MCDKDQQQKLYGGRDRSRPRMGLRAQVHVAKPVLISRRQAPTGAALLPRPPLLLPLNRTCNIKREWPHKA